MYMFLLTLYIYIYIYILDTVCSILKHIDVVVRA